MRWLCPNLSLELEHGFEKGHLMALFLGNKTKWKCMNTDNIPIGDYVRLIPSTIWDYKWDRLKSTPNVGFASLPGTVVWSFPANWERKVVTKANESVS